MDRRARAVVAADNPLQRWRLTVALNRHGCQVVAQDGIGPHAVQLADALRPDIILVSAAVAAIAGQFVNTITARQWAPVVLSVSDVDPVQLTAALAAALPSETREVRG